MLKELIRRIKCICVRFDNHKQEVFNLVQAVKTLYLYTKGEKESVEEYGRKSRACGTPWRRSETPPAC